MLTCEIHCQVITNIIEYWLLKAYAGLITKSLQCSAHGAYL